MLCMVFSQSTSIKEELQWRVWFQGSVNIINVVQMQPLMARIKIFPEYKLKNRPLDRKFTTFCILVLLH